MLVTDLYISRFAGRAFSNLLRLMGQKVFDQIKWQQTVTEDQSVSSTKLKQRI